MQRDHIDIFSLLAVDPEARAAAVQVALVLYSITNASEPAITGLMRLLTNVNPEGAMHFGAAMETFAVAVQKYAFALPKEGGAS